MDGKGPGPGYLQRVIDLKKIEEFGQWFLQSIIKFIMELPGVFWYG